MIDSDELDVEKLARRASEEFARRAIEIEPFAESEHDPLTWHDAIVFVCAGAIEIVCASGGRARFRRGDILCLEPLSVRIVRNPTRDPARLLVISRRKGTPQGREDDGSDARTLVC